MSDDNADATEGKGKKGKKDKGEKGKSNLVPALVLAAGIAAGGYFMGGSGDAKATEAEAAPVKEKPIPGLIATMDPLSVNLAGGHFLKVGIALQLIEGIESGEFEKGPISKAKDLLIEQIGGMPMEELTSPEGRKKVKDELTKSAKEIYEDEVLDVYFTDFVMQ